MSAVGEPHVGLVVEGPGDAQAVPCLLRMHQYGQGDYRDILGKPVPLNGVSKATRAGGIEGYVATAARRPGCVGVLIIVDGDDRCPVEFAAWLGERADSVVPNETRIVIAVRDFEDWIYASAETLDLELEYDPATRGLGAIRGALQPKAYVKPVWQPRLTSRMNIEAARRRSSSLDRALRVFDELRGMVR